MAALELFGLILFFIVVAAGLVSIVFGLPGCWIILADAAVYALFTGFAKISWPILAILFGLALVGEGVEFLAGVYGAKRWGASRRAVLGALGGAVLGAILLSPLIFLVGALLGAFLGAFIGAFLVEYLFDRDTNRALRSGWGAFLGRTAGLLAKGAMAVGMAALIVSRFL